MEVKHGWLYREIPDLETYPRFYAPAYRLYDMRATVCYPIGLNLVVRYWRHGTQRIFFAYRPDAFWRILSRVQEEAYRDGRRDGKRDELLEEMRRLRDYNKEKETPV